MNTNILFRGRSVFETNGYPCVSWPEHPESYEAGWVYVHRVVGLEKYGMIPEKYHIHHRDGDRWSWDIENLLLVKGRKHISNHRSKEKVIILCEQCGEQIKIVPSEKDRIKYCSKSCRKSGREKINWPPNSILEGLVWEYPRTEIAKRLGVSDRAIEKRCSKLGIETPDRGYWRKKRT